MFHKNLLILFICMVSASALTAQNLIPHQYALGGSAPSGPSGPYIDSEGNYYLFISVSVTGNQDTGNLGTIAYGSNFFIVSKHNENHELIWRQAYGGDSTDIINGVVQVNDGFIMSARSNSTHSGTKTIESNGYNHIWLQKIDFDGNIIWQKGLFATDHANTAALTSLSDGNLLICSHTEAGIGGDKSVQGIGSSDIWLLKIDEHGEKLWDACVGTEYFDSFGFHLGNFSNGDFLIGTTSDSGISGDKTEESYGQDDVWLIRLSQTDGQINWDKTIGGSSSEVTPNGSIVDDFIYLFISSHSDISGLRSVPLKGISDCWFLRLDESGEILNQFSFGGSSREMNFRINEISDSQLFLSIASDSPLSLDKNEDSRGEYDIWMIRSDMEGNILHQKTIGGDHNDFQSGMITLPNGNYLVAATSRSGISGEKTVPAISPNTNHSWIFEIDAVTLNIVKEHLIVNESILFPNPASNQINISFTEPTKLNKAVLYDLSGKVVLEQDLSASLEANYVLNTQGLASGVYSLSLVGDGFVKTQQVVVQ